MADTIETLGGDAADAVGPDAAPAEPLDNEFEDYDTWVAREHARKRPPGVVVRGVKLRLKRSMSIRAEMAVTEGFTSSDSDSLNRIVAELVEVIDDDGDPFTVLVEKDLDDQELNALFAWAWANYHGKPMTYIEAYRVVIAAEQRDALGDGQGKDAGGTRTPTSRGRGRRSSATSGATTA
jgi:hypothetical protein